MPGAIARIARSSSGAVAPTTSPTVPPGPQPAARRAIRAWSGSCGAPVAGSASTRRPCTSPAPGFDVRHRTYANRSARSRSGAIASSPRYGLTVIASAARTSNSAVACRAAVDPISPRLASATTGTSSGIDPAQAFEGGHPRRPEGLEEREVGLHRGRVWQSRLEEELGKTLHTRQVSGKPLGECPGSGSSPRQRTVLVAAERAASRSRYGPVTGPGTAMPPATPPPR